MSQWAEFTEGERRLLLAISKGRNEMAALQDIAARLGYRPARSGILAVSAMCRAMLRKYPYCGAYPKHRSPDTGRFIHRIPPRDQWDCAYWCLTKEARELISNLTEEERVLAASK